MAPNKGDPVPQTTTAFRAITKAQPWFARIAETDALPWTGRPQLELYKQTRVAANGHAITLLWAELPDEDDHDYGLQELDTPKFR